MNGILCEMKSKPSKERLKIYARMYATHVDEGHGSRISMILEDLGKDQNTTRRDAH